MKILLNEHEIEALGTLYEGQKLRKFHMPDE
jgi:hypothetical protein